MAEWIDTEEASQLSGYHINYLRVLLRGNKIISKKKGGAFWIDKASLLKYVGEAKDSEDRRHGARKRKAQR